MNGASGNHGQPGSGPRGRLVLNWESAAKIGAGLLLAIALLSSLPALMRSNKPPPLESDVGLPQAAPPPPAPVVSGQAAPARGEAKPRHRVAGKRRTPPPPEPPHRGRRRQWEGRAEPAAPQPIPVASAPGPPPAPEDFGFERP
ncbi:MAG: hypothetical protein ABR536_02385 [Solirubrobacterales bacterium]